MPTKITIVTTANRTLRFTQSDPARISEIIESLKRCAQIFSKRTLVLVSDQGTEIFSPSAITRIEIETNVDLVPYLPPAMEISTRALALGETEPPSAMDEEHIATRVDFYFAGGDLLPTWFERPRPSGAADRTMQVTRLFEQSVIPYRLLTPGIGLMNPAVMTRASLGIAMSDLPTGAWHVNHL